MTKVLILGSGCREFAIINKLLRDDPTTIIHYSDNKRNVLLSRVAHFIDIYYIKNEYIEYDIIIAGPEKYCGDFLTKLNYNTGNTIIWGANGGNEYLEYSKIFTRRFIHTYCSSNENNPNPTYIIHKNINNFTDNNYKQEVSKLYEEFNIILVKMEIQTRDLLLNQMD